MSPNFPFPHFPPKHNWYNRGTWPAHWVICPGAEQPPAVAAYRLRFTLTAAIRIALYVTADERYELFCDGERLGRGPERGDPRHWFYETYTLDLSGGEHRSDGAGVGAGRPGPRGPDQRASRLPALPGRRALLGPAGHRARALGGQTAARLIPSPRPWALFSWGTRGAGRHAVRLGLRARRGAGLAAGPRAGAGRAPPGPTTNCPPTRTSCCPRRCPRAWTSRVGWARCATSPRQP